MMEIGPPGPLGLHGLDGLKGVKGDMGTRGVSLHLVTLATRGRLEIQRLSLTHCPGVALCCLSEHPKHVCCLVSNRLELSERLS